MLVWNNDKVLALYRLPLKTFLLRSKTVMTSLRASSLIQGKLS